MQWEKITSFKTRHMPRAYVNSLVRFHHEFSDKERLEAAEKAGWNVFQFPSELLLGGDLLSDSGTTTLTSEQLSAMILGDEAYGTNYGYPKLIEAFEKTFDISEDTYEIYIFHQGRAAEHALFSQLAQSVPKNSVVPSNGHFDTTRANIEANNIEALDIKGRTEQTLEHFKGNMDIAALEKLLKEDGERIPLVYTTITNNTGGGQPVSLQNIKKIRALCDEYGKPFFLDACRFAENAWFIKQYEEKTLSIHDIVRNIFALCDGFTISLKKDGLSNMGGALVIKKDSMLTKTYPKLLNDIRDHQILTEGHPTYGGLTGRDIMSIVEGLKTVITEQYLSSRIGLVRAFGECMDFLNIPVLKPFGGHAVYIDVDKFFEGTNMGREDFGGISLTALLLLKGVRLCELGAFAFGKWNSKTQKEEFNGNNFVRCAVPRNKYELQDLQYVADCVKGLHEQKEKIPKAVPVYGRELTLRHFKARFELK
ncbi:MAG: tryptophanase [Parcubacteria group bacterium]|nr:tryptophanase [Parcubacteria group bacterium]